MRLQNTALFDTDASAETFFESFEPRPAVFILFPDEGDAADQRPYISRTADLRRRLIRLLGRRERTSKLLSLRTITRRIEYAVRGLGL